MRICILFVYFLFLSSCSAQEISGWFSSFKDYSLSQLASAADNHLSDEDRMEILYLFSDLYGAGPGECAKVKRYIENNKALKAFENSYGLPRGFLFDEFYGFNYESSFINLNKSLGERAAFTVVSVWKTKFSLEEIDFVLSKVKKCYPREYLSSFESEGFLKTLKLKGKNAYAKCKGESRGGRFCFAFARG